MVERKPLDQITVDFYRKVMDVNVLSTIMVTQALLPMMDRGSVVINMSSLAARRARLLADVIATSETMRPPLHG